jgi:hypothetical protein
MASQPSNYQLEDVFQKHLSGGDFPRELRGDFSDTATKMVYLDRDIAPFSYLIHKRFPQAGKGKNTVKDRVFEVREIDEHNRFLTVTVASSDTYHTQFGISNNQAAELHENDIIYIRNLYAIVTATQMVMGQVYPASGGSQGTNVGPDLGSDVGANPTFIAFSRQKGNVNGVEYRDYEQMKVIEIGKPDTAGSGNTLITVTRCFMGPSEEDVGGRLLLSSLVYSANGIGNATAGGTGSASVAVDIRIGDTIYRSLPSFREGTNAPNGTFKFPSRDTNFTQEFKFANEKTKESDIPAKHVKELTQFDAFQTQRWLNKRLMTRCKEYSYLFSRKMRSQYGGDEEFTLGGIYPFIMKDDRHIIYYPAASITWPGMLDIGKNIFGLGGSSERIGLIGITLEAELRKSFWNEHLWYNKEASKAFNMEVNTLIMSGGKIQLIVSQVMEENGHGNEMICLDMSNKDTFEPVTNAGWDYKLDAGPGGYGIQEAGSMKYKEQIIGIHGLRRRYKRRHCIIDFSNAVAVPSPSQP